jgi:hypothetical protein
VSQLDTSAIDEQINTAKSRKNLQDSVSDTPTNRGRRKLTDEERLEREQVRADEKAKRQQEREARRAAKREADANNGPPAHMKKVEKALEKLPKLSSACEVLFSQLTSEFDLRDVEMLTAHLTTYVRAQRTREALNCVLKVGEVVRIQSGNPKYVGLVGTVARTQHIRCYVSLPNFKHDVYLFTSDVTPLSFEEAQTVENDDVVEVEQKTA